LSEKGRQGKKREKGRESDKKEGEYAIREELNMPQESESPIFNGPRTQLVFAQPIVK
jgi:hypothetical protein